MVGSPQILMCMVNTVEGVESNLVAISWTGLEGFYTNNSRITIETDRRELQISETHNTYNSTLRFAYLMEGDEGMYTCGVTILDTSNFQKAEIETLISKQGISK